MSIEIERAFVADHPPELQQLGPARPLRQGYVAREAGVEVRVRIAGGHAHLTVKSGGGMVRTEVEFEVPLDAAEALWPLTEGRRLSKDRYRVEVEGHTAEVDLYHDDLAGLCRIEVEFADAATAQAFTPPAWFGREVTDEPGWSNGSLARHGRPDRMPGDA